MTLKCRERSCSPKRPTLFLFETLKSFRNRIVRRAGRLSWPGARPVLTISAKADIAEEIKGYMAILG